MGSFIRIPADVLIAECDQGISRLKHERELRLGQYCADQSSFWNLVRTLCFMSPVWNTGSMKEHLKAAYQQGRMSTGTSLEYKRHAHYGQMDLERIRKIQELAKRARSISSVSHDESYNGVYISADDLDTLRQWSSSTKPQHTE